MIGRTVSHYRIVGRLGAGGMGEVYQAEDTRLKRTVALKFLPPEMTRDEEAKRRFQQEAEAAAALDHPHICTIYEVGETEEGHLFIAMACYPGETLKARLEKGPLPAAEAAWLAAQAAAGLAHAHAKGIVHRDVKPANLMLTADGGVKVLDFGLAKLVGQTTRTKDGSTLGTVAYMSPEQAGGAKVDARTDVWSLGAVLYEMATGRVPFEGDYSQAVIYGILNHDPVAPSKIKPDLPPELERVILLCLAKDPDQRIQTMAELAAELGEAGVTGPMPTGLKTRRSGRRHRQAKSWLNRHWRVVSLVLLLIAITGGIAYWQWQTRESGPPTPSGPVRLTLAVLPFENLGSPDKRPIVEGLTEQVISRLAQVYGLKVSARTDVAEYEGTKKKVRQIAAELGVDYLLEGSVRWQTAAPATEQLRVTAQLIQASDGTTLWTDQYDETAADILGKQSLIAEKVAVAMREKLVDGERKDMAATSTRNVAAYECYLKAFGEAEKLDDALQLCERATALDPIFTEAWLGRFHFHLEKYRSGEDCSEQRVKLAWESLEKARELEPDHPSYHVHLARWYATVKNDYRLAEEECLSADRGRPGDREIMFYLRSYAWSQEKYGAAVRYAERTTELHPNQWWAWANLGQRYRDCQRYADAERALKRAMALDPESKELFPYRLMARVIVMRDGDPVKALNYLDSLSPVLRQKEQKQYNYYIYLKWAGQHERVLEFARSLPEIIQEDKNGIRLKATFMGQILTEMGRPEEALAAYSEALHQLDRLAEDRKGRCQEERLLAERRDIVCGLGRKEEAIHLARELVEMVSREKDRWGHFYHVLNLAWVYARFGEYGPALDQLEYYFSQPVPNDNFNEVKLEPVYKPLLSLPRFKALEKKYPPDKPYTGP